MRTAALHLGRWRVACFGEVYPWRHIASCFQRPVLSSLWRPVEGRSVLHALAETCVDGRARNPEALARRVHGHRQLRTPPHAHALLAGDAVVAAVELHAKAAVPAQVGGAHLRAAASDPPSRGAARSRAAGARLAAGVVAAVLPRQVSRAAVVVRVNQLVHQHVFELVVVLHRVVAHHHLRPRRVRRAACGATRSGGGRTPSGGRKPPTTFPSHASTLKKRRSTAQPALRIASSMNLTVAPARRKGGAISRRSHPPRGATRGRTALQRVVQRLLTYLGRHAPRRRGARASAVLPAACESWPVLVQRPQDRNTRRVGSRARCMDT